EAGGERLGDHLRHIFHGLHGSSSLSFRRWGLAAVVVVALTILMGLAYDCADTCACGSADDGAFEATAEERAEDGSAACSDERSFAGSDAALIAAVVVVVAIVIVVVILAAATAIADSVVEVGIIVPIISVLGAGTDGEETCGQHERGDEYSFAYLHHAELDAGLVGRVRIFSRVVQASLPEVAFLLQSLEPGCKFTLSW